jgi:hypothetical protein
MAGAPHRLVVSVDLDEWFHSRRWLNGEQTRGVPDMPALFRRLYGSDQPAGEIVPPTRALLDLFDRHRVSCTFFVLGEVAEWYPDLVTEIASRGHEVACHGMHHVDMTVLGPERFARELDQAVTILNRLVGRPPCGYRAPNLVYEPWATRLLEDRGFVYDTTVCVSRPIGGKYIGWADAPLHPYRPSYDAIGREGTARLVELPLPSFPVVNLSAGSGILTRVLGLWWTRIALTRRLQTGDTGFYFHPWEVAAQTRPIKTLSREAVFYRHTGDWMLRAVDALLARFDGQVVTGLAAAEAFRARADARGPSTDLRTGT